MWQVKLFEKYSIILMVKIEISNSSWFAKALKMVSTLVKENEVRCWWLFLFLQIKFFFIAFFIIFLSGFSFSFSRNYLLKLLSSSFVTGTRQISKGVHVFLLFLSSTDIVTLYIYNKLKIHRRILFFSNEILELNVLFFSFSIIIDSYRYCYFFLRESKFFLPNLLKNQNFYYISLIYDLHWVWETS